MSTERQRDYVVGPVKRALSVLSHIGESDVPLGLADISADLSIPKSTAYKYLHTLRESGFVVQNEADAYQLGPAVWRLNRGRHVWRAFQTLARPHLERLRHAYGETAALVELNGLEARCLDVVESRHRLRVGLPVGHRFPVYSTASGKAILAFVPEQWKRMHTPLAMTPFTNTTITDFDAFLEELDRTADRGWASEIGEDDPHTTAVAAPVLDRIGRSIVAITLLAPSNRLTVDDLPAVGEELIKTARLISAELGVAAEG